MMLLSFCMLLPFFALLIWLALIAKPSHRQVIVSLATLSLTLSAFTSAVAFDLARASAHAIWPHVVAALLAFSVFLTVFSFGFLRLPSSNARSDGADQA